MAKIEGRGSVPDPAWYVVSAFHRSFSEGEGGTRSCPLRGHLAALPDEIGRRISKIPF
jgi:hypothetical protein